MQANSLNHGPGDERGAGIPGADPIGQGARAGQQANDSGDDDDSALESHRESNVVMRCARGLGSAMGRLSWGTRVKIAVVLSFGLLIGSPILNKLRGPRKPSAGEQAESQQAPTLAIQGAGTAKGGEEDRKPVTPPLAPEATAAERLTAGEMSGQEGAQEVVATSSPVNATPVDGTGPLAPAGSAGKDVGSPPGDGGLGSALSEPEALSAPATVLAGNTAQPTPPDPRLLEEVPPPATATLLDRQGVPPSPPELESSLALELPDAASEAAVGTPPRGSGVEPRSTPAERVEAEGSESVASGSGSTAKVTPAAVPRTVAPSSIQFEPAPTPPQVAASERAGAVPAPRKIARTSEDEVIGAALEPVSHVVRRGENFWTISRHYYGSGRYYRALWRANVDTVPKVDELYVGSTILVPPPEHLDREFIDPPARVQRAGSKSTLGRRETDRRQD